MFWKKTVEKYNFSVIVIHENLSWEEACSLEKFYIAKIGRRDLGKGTLVNHTDGGDGTSGYRHTEIAKRKIGEYDKIRNFSEETRKKLSAIHKGKPLTDSHKEKLSNSLKGRKTCPFTEEHKRKISEALKGKKREPFTRKKVKLTDSHKRALSKSLSDYFSKREKKDKPEKKKRISHLKRRVFIDGKVYDSLHEAAKEMKIPLNTLRNRLVSVKLSVRQKYPNWYYLT